MDEKTKVHRIGDRILILPFISLNIDESTNIEIG